MGDLLETSTICYHVCEALRTLSHQIINNANYFISLALPWFILPTPGDHSLPFWACDPLLSVWVCLVPCLLLTCNITLTRVRGEPISKRLMYL